MKKKWLKISIALVVFSVAILGLGNWAINYWLQHKLSDFIKNNSDYNISYNALDVQLETGNIIATGIKIETKHTNPQETENINGSIDTLEINRLGIWDALLRKKINPEHLYMAKPNLAITLAKPNSNKTKKSTPIGLRNVKISNGTLAIYQHDGQKLLSANRLDLSVSELKINKKSIKNQLPITFEKYNISGQNFYYKPNDTHVAKAKNISTKNGIMSLQDLEFYPTTPQKQFLDLKISQVDFNDIHFKNNKISLSEATFQEPKIKLYATDKKNTKKEKPFNYTATLGKVALHNASLEIVKPNGTTQLRTEDFNLIINNLEADKNTTQNIIPFSYKNFQFATNNIDFNTDNQKISLYKVNLNPQQINIEKGLIKSSSLSSVQTSANAQIDKISMKIKELGFVDNKLKINAEQLNIAKISGTIIAPTQPKKKQHNFESIAFPLTINKIILGESQITLKKGQQSETTFKHLKATINNLKMNEQTTKQGLPFSAENYEISTKNLDYKINRFYRLNVGNLKLTKHDLEIQNLALKPQVSRARFIKMIPAERDLYDIQVKKIALNGTMDFMAKTPYIDAQQATIVGANANIFRSKIPPDDPTEKAMYSEQLRQIKFPLYIKNLDLKESVLVYEEDTKKSDGPGKLVFSNFNMNIKNLNSRKIKNRPSEIPIAIQCRFMEVSPMVVNWKMNTANLQDYFSISGRISQLPATNINAFVEPYLKIKTNGQIEDLQFDFAGNKRQIGGTMNMKYKELKVSILRESGEKNKLISAIANIFVKSNSGRFPENVTVENVERDATKSFFNLFWQGLQSGLTKTLIVGKNKNRNN